MMHNKWTSVTPLLLAAALILGMSLMAFAANSGKQELASVTTNPDLGWFNGNRIFSYMENNGSIVSYHYDGNAGMYWPSRESLLTIDFQAGVWVSGLVEGVPRTACAEFASEWTPGMVLPDGTPDNPNDAKYKLYKIHKLDAADPTASDDWMNWPVDQGAPWIDKDGDGVYDPLVDSPDIVGDEMIWYVMNDLGTANHGNVFSTAPLGLECRVTVWGYDRPDEFGNMMFAKFQLFNRKTTTAENCYLGLWSDIDLGNGSDDFAGCDTTLSLGYVYNDGADNMYGSACPAIGADFFQGAVVPSPGDSAKTFGKMIPDYKNLGMDVFINYIRGDASLPDPESGQECYNYMSGLRNDGSKFVDPTTGEEMDPARVFAGDPVTGTGWVDALENTSGDRRILQTCGPFTIAPGDSQEVVTATIIAQGADHLNSITLLKQADVKAQTAYDIDFALPDSPPSPAVKAIAMSNEIVLTWDAAAESYEGKDQVDTDADGNPSYYEFQGYNVYQLESTSGQGVVKLLGTFDVEDGIKEIKDIAFVPAIGENVERVVQKGSDSGLKHSMIVTSDALNGNQPLINNRPYYFLVSAYAYNEMGIPKTLESSTSKDKIVTVYPQMPFGLRATASDTSTIEVAHVSGGSQGEVTVEVVAPTEVTGHDYKVEFVDGDDGVYWRLVDTTTGEIVLDDQTHQGLDDSHMVVDGLMVKVSGPSPGMYACVEVANPSFAWPNVPEDQMDASGAPFGGNNIWHSLGFSDDANYNGTLVMGSQGAYEGDLSRQHDYEIRFTDAGSWACSAFSTYAYYKAPFEVWDVGDRTYDDPSDDVQMMAAIYEDVGTADVFDLPNGDATDDTFGLPCTDRIYMYYVDADGVTYADYAAALEAGDTGAADYMWGMVYNRPYGRLVFMNYEPYLTDGWESDNWLPASGTVVRLISTKANMPADVFTFSTAGLEPATGADITKEDIENINVFPNPYFGANVEEVQPLEHFVRFTHLPEDGVTLRVYNLAGELVRTIEHDNGTQFEEWDLQNEYDIPVSSGMYIVHVDCGDLGEKILKLALIMPEERLRQY